MKLTQEEQDSLTMGLLRNAIRTPDGTILESHNRHDYKTYVDKNGHTYMVDGGLDYSRRIINEEAPYTSLNISVDADIEEIREGFTWGTYGKNGDEGLYYKPLKDMSDGHVQAIINDMYWCRPIMKLELQYRKINGIVVCD